ncbi:hypothetical protein LCGC14_1057480 [marine sediment metagenome]|uniref:Putative regulatory protein FmdB zinc ribbon domain-containing protein n=1 Tax=marine sediment metagenome TaxID=412755 RepID=A0A0F9Q548_9ZZZZ
MPIYEYKCEKCDTNFEELQTKNEKVVCPGCGGTSLKKMFSLFAREFLIFFPTFDRPLGS